MTNFIVLIIYLASSTYGLYMLKSSPQILSVNFAIGFTAYAAGFLIWLYLLMRMPLSIVFPVAAGGLIVCTQFAGLILLNEKLGIYQVAGVMLVLTGITMIYLKA